MAGAPHSSAALAKVTLIDMARNYAALPYEYLEEMEDLSDTEFGRLTRALLKYSMTGEQMALSGNERLFAKRVMNQEDRFKSSYAEISERRAEAGRKGALSRWNNHGKMANDSNQWQTHGKNGNTKTNTNTKPIEKKDTPISPRKKTGDSEEARQVIDYLNEKTGARFRYSINSLKHVNARLHDGFTVDDCKTVIDKKCEEWLTDPKMSAYLRPETLFGGKFEGYLNAKTVKGGFSKRQDVLPGYYDANPYREASDEHSSPAEVDELKSLLKSKRK